MKTRSIGQLTEQAAADYLTNNGLTLIASNVSYPFGEIDLIMRDKHRLIFIEVRYRSRPDFGSALESITPQKQERLTKAAHAYLVENNLWQRCDCRFDAVTLSGNIQDPQIEWFKNLW